MEKMKNPTPEITLVPESSQKINHSFYSSDSKDNKRKLDRFNDSKKKWIINKPKNKYYRNGVFQNPYDVKCAG